MLKASRFPTHPNIWWMSGKYTEFVPITPITTFVQGQNLRHCGFLLENFPIRMTKKHATITEHSVISKIERHTNKAVAKRVCFDCRNERSFANSHFARYKTRGLINSKESYEYTHRNFTRSGLRIYEQFERKSPARARSLHEIYSNAPNLFSVSRLYRLIVRRLL